MSSQRWTEWDDSPSGRHLGCMAKMHVDVEGKWIHFLLAPPGESDPRNNHIHIKYYNSVNATPVLCGITDGGNKSHSRKQLLDRVNGVTGLNLEYK